MKQTQIAIASYGLASMFYVPVVIYGASQNIRWLDIYGAYLLGPILIAMALYLYAFSFLNMGHFVYIILHGSLMLGIIFGIPLLSWNRWSIQPCDTCNFMFQTAPLMGIAGIFLFINFLVFINIITATHANQKVNTKSPSIESGAL